MQTFTFKMHTITRTPHRSKFTYQSTEPKKQLNIE